MGEHGFFTRISGLFGAKKVDRDALIVELRKHKQDITRELASLKYDVDLKNREFQRVRKDGIEASRKGDTFSKSDAAKRLQACNLEISRIQRERMMGMDARIVLETSLSRLESARPDGIASVMAGIQRALNRPEVKNELDNQRATVDSFADTFAKAVALELGSAEVHENRHSADIEDIMKGFDEIVEGETKGDSEKVRLANERLSNAATDAAKDPLMDI